MSIVAEIPGFLQLLSDGSVKRFPSPTPVTLPDSSNGHKCKDIVIDAEKHITARIYVPNTHDQLHPLRVLVYFHGGGFCFCSTTHSGFHDYLVGLCVRSQVLILSVDYRLAPEHKIPAAYDDCYTSLQWLTRNASVELWLERADLSRVFLSGESAGGNIVHHVMLRVVKSPVQGVDIKGLMIIHPFFGSEERTESELADDVEKSVGASELLWRLALPEGADRDHWACNYENGEETDVVVDWKRFPAVVVFVAGQDVLSERGRRYAEFLEGKGLKIELVTTEGQPHAFHILSPDSQPAHLLQSQMADFMKIH